MYLICHVWPVCVCVCGCDLMCHWTARSDRSTDWSVLSIVFGGRVHHHVLPMDTWPSLLLCTTYPSTCPCSLPVLLTSLSSWVTRISLFCKYINVAVGRTNVTSADICYTATEKEERLLLASTLTETITGSNVSIRWHPASDTENSFF